MHLIKWWYTTFYVRLMFCYVCSEVVKIYVVVITHVSDVELFVSVCEGGFFFLLSLLLLSLTGFLKSFIFGGLHRGDGFSLSNLGFSLLLGLKDDGFFLLGFLFFIVLVAVTLFDLRLYVFDEGFQNGLHLFAGLPVIHAGVLI